MRDLEDKVAIITGSSRGIGRVIADVLSRKGCSIIINYKSNFEGAKETLKLVESNNSKGLIVQADISQYKEGRELVKKVIDYFGTIDYLVNNAAAPGPQRRAEKISPEEWAETLATNPKIEIGICGEVDYTDEQIKRLINVDYLSVSLDRFVYTRVQSARNN